MALEENMQKVLVHTIKVIKYGLVHLVLFQQNKLTVPRRLSKKSPRFLGFKI